jgi:zinc protease
MPSNAWPTTSSVISSRWPRRVDSSSQVYKRDSMMAQAMEIGGIEAAGFHWRDIDRMLEKLKAVTPEQVQAVAKKYFSDDVLTVATLDPQPVDPKSAAKPSVPLKH